MNSAAAGADAYDHKWPTMAAIVMGIFLATIDGSIVNVALPTLVKRLETDFAMIQWVVLGYLLTVTTLMLGIGRLGDMIGKKKLYVAGFVVFTAGSVLCGLSPTVQWLIGFRVVQAVGAALIMALGMAIITEAFPPSERGKALGISGAAVSVGIVIGPSLGGLIISQLSWRWIFLVNLPVGILGTLMVLRFVRVGPAVGGQRFDFGGALTLFISLLCLLLGLTLGQQGSFFRVDVAGLLVASLILLGLFITIERRVTQPIIDLRFFRHPLFTINLANAFFAFVAVSGVVILLPFYLENIRHYPIFTVGLMLCIVPVTLGITSPISGILSDRFGTQVIATIGLVIVLGSYLLASTLDENTTTWGYILRLAPLGLGMGIFQSPNNSAIMGSVPPRALGVASSITNLSRTLGQTVGTAVLGAFWAGRTFFHDGAVLSEGATAASSSAQVAGLQETFWVAAGLMVLAILFSFCKRFFRPAPGLVEQVG
jgi:EmrB/QacA subfamily drug resistance transporter